MRSDLAAYIFGLVGLAGCATIVSGTDSTTSLNTTPQAAQCSLQGHNFDAAVTTPASVTLPASAAPIAVTCKAGGYRPGTARLETSQDGWIMGNLLFGGVIGAIVDSTTGAGRKYPPQLTLFLEPETFASATERDKWYFDREADVRASSQQAIDAKKGQCGNTSMPAATCHASIEALEADQKREIEQLELRRQATASGASAAPSRSGGSPGAAIDQQHPATPPNSSPSAP